MFEVKEYAQMASNKTNNHEDRSDNPVQLLTNPPRNEPGLFDSPIVQAAAAGALAAGLDVVLTRVMEPGTGQVMVSTLGKGALGYFLSQYEDDAMDTPWVHAGSALMGAAAYQGGSLAVMKWMTPAPEVPQSQPPAQPPALPAPQETGALVHGLPPGYQFVPAMNAWVPVERLAGVGF